MSFDDDERSVAQNRASEIYDFFDAAGNHWRYTSARRDVVFGGQTYVAAPIRRDATSESSVVDPPQFTIECAYDLAVVQANSFSAAPPQGLAVSITRVQEVSGASLLWWSGFVTSINVTGRVAKLVVPSAIDDALGTTLPGAYFQATCNHHLYDGMCTVNRSFFKLSTTLAAPPSGTGLVVASIGGHPDGYYAGGEVVHTSSGQRRTILQQLGTAVTVTIGFRGALNGDAVDLYAGCDHLVTTCRDKFGNVPNFGGFPYVPQLNAFEKPLK